MTVHERTKYKKIGRTLEKQQQQQQQQQQRDEQQPQQQQPQQQTEYNINKNQAIRAPYLAFRC